jgi:protein ImuB
MFSTMPRRIAAIVLPHLLSEIGSQQITDPSAQRRPLGIVLLQRGQQPQQLTEHSRLDAVDEHARRLGLTAGLTVAEGRAYVAGLQVCAVHGAELEQALQRVAEVAMEFGPTVAVSLPDTVHVDLTGAAHLAGGEEAVAATLAARVEQLEHVARIAIAEGPRLAACVARHGPKSQIVVPSGQGARWMHPLPALALPIDSDTASWLLRVGVITVGDLARLPRDQVASRLGERAAAAMQLMDGRDDSPLQPYEPPPQMSEALEWEEGVEQQQALLFVLRRLCSRLAARLQGRGMAAAALVLTIDCDSRIAQLRSAQDRCVMQIDLPAALSHADDLLRTLKAALEQRQLGAPALGMLLAAPRLMRAASVQLDLSRTVTASPDALPVLLAEVAAEIGPDRVGVLAIQSSYRPEGRSILRPVLSTSSSPGESAVIGGLGSSVTRLLTAVVSMGRGPITAGRLLICGPSQPLQVQSVQFDARLDGIEWWTGSPVSRDYVRVWLTARGRQGVATAWAYTDRDTQESWLHGWLD